MSTARVRAAALSLAAVCLGLTATLGAVAASAGGPTSAPSVQASFGWDRPAAAGQLPG